MNQLLFDNPVLIKHLRSRLRQPQAAYLVLVVFVLCCCVLWAAFAGMGFQDGVPFTLFFLMQGCALHLVGTNQVATSIGQVNDSGVLDFHRISPLPPSATALGFVLGAPIREYLVAAIALPFALFAATQGRPGLLGFATTGLVLLSSTWLFHLLAMTAGLVVSRGKSRGTNLGIGAFVVFSLLSTSSIQIGLPIPGMLTAGPAFYEAMGWNQAMPGRQVNLPTFFGLELPLFLQTLCYQLPLIVFLAVPVVRRMRSGEASLYSKRSAIGFLVAISVLNVGGIIGHKNIQAQWIIPSLLYLNGVFAMFLTMAVTPNQGAFLNHLRRSNKQGKARPSVWTDDASNRATVLVLCVLTYGMVQSVETFANVAAGGPRNVEFLVPSITTLATIAYFGFAAQIFRIRTGRPGNATLFVFLFFVWLLPLIAGALCSMTFGQKTAEVVFAISPVMGIATKSVVSLSVSCGLAGLFFVALIREERRQWTKIRTAALTEEVESAQDSLPTLEA